MIEDEFIKEIEHSVCIEGEIENSTCCAFKIDDVDGLATHLGFYSNIISKVDYFSKKENEIQLIELTDLKNSIQKCGYNLAEELDKAEKKKGKRLTTREERPIRKRVWLSVTGEFKQKWNGSIAIIERLYRKNKIYNDNPKYQLLIVCKNNTDIKMLDILKSRLQGMIKTVNICDTKNISSQLINTKI